MASNKQCQFRLVIREGEWIYDPYKLVKYSCNRNYVLENKKKVEVMSVIMCYSIRQCCGSVKL
jgi:hypothetical protein